MRATACPLALVLLLPLLCPYGFTRLHRYQGLSRKPLLLRKTVFDCIEACHPSPRPPVRGSFSLIVPESISVLEAGEPCVHTVVTTVFQLRNGNASLSDLGQYLRRKIFQARFNSKNRKYNDVSRLVSDKHRCITRCPR